MALGDISNPMVADIAGALSYRDAQLEKAEQKRKELRTRQLISEAIPSLPEGHPIRELMLTDPIKGAAVAQALGIPLNRGDQMAKFSSDVATLSRLSDADPHAAYEQAKQMQAEYKDIGMPTGQLDKWVGMIDQSIQNNDNQTFTAAFNALHVMNNALNPKKPDYEAIKIQQEQQKIDQKAKMDAANLSIEQQKLALEKDKAKAGESTAVTYQTDENGNLVALPTHLPAGAAPVSSAVTNEKGQPIKGKGAALTESQSNAALFSARASEAQDIINKIGTDYSVTGLNAKRSVEWLPGIGAAANAMMSKNQQSIEQAQRDFINAVLRKESGASISPQEFENAQKQYFPQPGDGADVIKQKDKNRQTAIAGLEVASGGGAKMVKEKLGLGNMTAAERLAKYKDGQ